MKIIFMGSATFSLPTLARLLESKHDVVAIIAQPDKPAGRGKENTPSPVARFAREQHLNLLQPATLKKGEVAETLRRFEADLFVVIAYGKILPVAILTIPPKGCINVHASLLPKYRGAAPINWAIVNGELETGVTTIFMNKEMDEGDILLSCKTEIDECETASQLHDRLASLGADLLMKTIEQLEKGKLTPRPQENDEATYAPILTKEDGHIDWSLPADQIYNWIRGLTPWPGAYAFIKNKRLNIYEAAHLDRKVVDKPGTVIRSDDELVVATGNGELYLLEVQLEGKKRMSTDAFLRGNNIPEGLVLT